MTTPFDPAGPIGYQPVEFLDIPPMGETVGNPPRLEPIVTTEGPAPAPQVRPTRRVAMSPVDRAALAASSKARS
jgi:hypothetical protein